MNSIEYLNSYRKWQSNYEIKQRLAWLYVFVLIVFFISLIFSILANLPLENLFSVFFFIIVSIFLLSLIFETKKIQQKEAAIYAALSTDEALASGDRVKATLSIEKLLNLLSRLLSTNDITFADRKYPSKNYIFIIPDEINIKNIHLYIQAELDNTDEVSSKLRELANNLSSGKQPDYLAVQQFFVFLRNRIDNLTSKKSKFSFLKDTIPILTILLGILVNLDKLGNIFPF